MTDAERTIGISIECADAMAIRCDVLVMKHAQALYGVDQAVVMALEKAGIAAIQALPEPGHFRVIPAGGALSANAVLFVGVTPLAEFGYAELRDFGARALSSLTGVPSTYRVALTLHGSNYGLDESEAFRAELAGLLDSIEAGNYPAQLESVVFVERNPRRAARLEDVLKQHLPAGKVAPRSSSGRRDVGAATTRASLAEVGEGSKQKPYAFVAMPFGGEFDDRFYYGIQRAADATGFLAERIDFSTFVGDIVARIRERIPSAAFVIADLTGANPNVYLEVGYAWAGNVPTILLVSDVADLKFDVKGQRCLVYGSSIRRLEELLTTEIKSLAAGGHLGGAARR
jgi:hypothetical protein